MQYLLRERHGPLGTLLTPRLQAREIEEACSARQQTARAPGRNVRTPQSS